MEMKKHEETLQMNEAESEDFDCLSLSKIWSILKQRVVAELVGIKFCPVADIANSYYFDMFNVYAKLPKGFLSKMTTFVAKDDTYSFIAKLVDILHHPAFVDKQKIFNDIAVIQKYERNLISPKFDVCLAHQDGNMLKKICLRAENTEIYEGSLLLDNRKFIINRHYPGLKSVNSILVVTQVCAANKLGIHARCGPKNEVKDWSFDGPWPVGFTAEKYGLDEEGVIQVRSNPEVPSEKLHLKKWGAPIGDHPPESITLKAFLQRRCS